MFVSRRLDISSTIESIYSSVNQSSYQVNLTVNSQLYTPTGCGIANHYYEPIQMNVTATGYYNLGVNSSVNTSGYIYKNKFTPWNPSQNLLSNNYGTCIYPGFRPISYLQANTTYVLVATMYSPSATGSFSILVYGPNKVSLKHFGEYMFFLVNNLCTSSEYRKS